MDGYSAYSRILRRRKRVGTPGIKRRYRGRSLARPYKRRRTAYRRRVPARRFKKRVYRRRTTARTGSRIKSAGINMKLHGCALEYLKVQYDPWTAGLKEAPCVPDLISFPSFKLMTRARGTMVTDSGAAGTAQNTGIGAILMNPYLPSSKILSTSLAYANRNWLAPIWYTNANDSTGAGLNVARDGITFRNMDSTMGPTVAANHGYTPAFWANSLISSDELLDLLSGQSSSKNYRPVGGGIKVSYSGVLQDRSGSYILYEAPDNENDYNMLGGSGNEPPSSITSSDFLLKEETQKTIVSEAPVSVVFHPRHMNDLQYATDYGYPQTAVVVDKVSNAVNLATYQTLCIAVFGCLGQSFDFDCVMHWEMIGSGIPSRTPSPSYPNEFAAITNGFPTQPSKKSPAQQLIEALSKLLRMLQA